MTKCFRIILLSVYGIFQLHLITSFIAGHSRVISLRYEQDLLHDDYNCSTYSPCLHKKFENVR